VWHPQHHQCVPYVLIHYTTALLMGELSLLEDKIWGRVCFRRNINASTKMLLPIEGSKQTIIILVPMQNI
jgi:hypothetical protein